MCVFDGVVYFLFLFKFRPEKTVPLGTAFSQSQQALGGSRFTASMYGFVVLEFPYWQRTEHIPHPRIHISSELNTDALAAQARDTSPGEFDRCTIDPLLASRWYMIAPL
jgi:hypothetical protein